MHAYATKVDTNNEAPMSVHDYSTAFPSCNEPSVPGPDEASEADKDTNTSGAPLPKARSVTPAMDSESPHVTVMRSRLGERYRSAVDARLYIAMTKMSP